MKFLLLITGLILLAACSDSTAYQEPLPVEARFSSIQVNLFDRSCAISGCHNGSQAPNLSGSGSYSRIVNVSSGNGGLDFIEPGNPSQSLLYLSLVGGSGVRVDRMPQGQTQLPAAITDSIRVWIANGAPNN